MSLSVYLELENEVKISSGIFVREDGRNVEISRGEWFRRHPDREPIVTNARTSKAFSANITHNLNTMADAAGIYEYLWRPEEVDVHKAEQLIVPLQKGLEELREHPEKYKEFNPSNGWGDYEGLLDFVGQYLSACKRYPTAAVSVWR